MQRVQDPVAPSAKHSKLYPKVTQALLNQKQSSDCKSHLEKKNSNPKWFKAPQKFKISITKHRTIQDVEHLTPKSSKLSEPSCRPQTIKVNRKPVFQSVFRKILAQVSVRHRYDTKFQTTVGNLKLTQINPFFFFFFSATTGTHTGKS